MALIGFPPFKVSDIRTELQNTGTAPFSIVWAGRGVTGYVPINQSNYLKTQYDKGVSISDIVTPFKVSEWSFYNHTYAPPCPDISVSTLTVGQIAYHMMMTTGNVTGTTSLANIRIENLPSTPPGVTVTYTTSVYNTYPFTNTGAVTGTPIFSTSWIYPATVPEIQFEYVTTGSTTYLHVVTTVEQTGGSGEA